MRAKIVSITVGKSLLNLTCQLIIGCGLLLSGLWILRAPLVQWIVNQPLPGGWSLTAREVSSDSITHWRLAELSLHKDAQSYFNFKGVELNWNPAYLWRGKFSVNRLHIDSATIFTAQKHSSQPAGLPNLAALPSLDLHDVHIQHLSINDGTVAPAIKSTQTNLTQTLNAQDYALSGNLQMRWGDVLLNLNAQLKNPQGDVVAQVNTRALNNTQWEISGFIDEPAEGMLAVHFGLPAQQALRAQANIAIEYWDKRYQINLTQLQFPWQQHTLAANGTLWLDNTFTHLEIGDLLVNTDGKAQRIQALITPGDQRITAQLNQLPLNLLSPWSPFDGGEASGDINFYRQSATAHIQLDAKVRMHSRYGGWPLEMSGVLAFSPERILTIKDAKVIWGAGNLRTALSGGGDFDLLGERNNLRIQGENFSYQHLRKLPINWLNQPQGVLARELHQLEFSADISQLRLTGPLKNPQITYNLDAKTRYRQHDFALHLQGEGNLSGAKLVATRAQQGEGVIDIQGTLKWTQPGNNLALRFSQWGQAFWPVYHLQALSDAQARVDGQAQLTGTLLAPIIDTQLTLSGQLPLRRWASFSLTNNARYQYSFARPWPKGLSLLDAQNIAFQIEATQRLQLTGTASHTKLDLALNCPQWDHELNQLLGLPLAAGTGNFSLKLSGTPSAPKAWGQWQYQVANTGAVPSTSAAPSTSATPSTSAASPNTALSTNTAPSTSAAPLVWRGELNTDLDNVTLNSQLNEADKNLASVQVSIPSNNFAQAAQLDAQIALNADLAASRLFIDGWRFGSGGQFNFTARVKGTATAPNIIGTAQIKDGYFADKNLGIELQKINVQLGLQGNALAVQTGSAEDKEKGRVKLAGGCTVIYPNSQCALQLNLDHLKIINNRQISSQASGEILASLHQQQIKLTGALTLSPTALTLANNFGSNIRELTVEETRQRAQYSAGLAWPSPLVDIQWALGSNSQVRGRGLDAQIAGTLHTQGPLNDLAYNGNFYTSKGTMELFNKRFVLGTGEIRVAPRQIYLNIPATYQSRVGSGEDFTIQARLYGDANQLKLDLNSTPSLPADEILARLIFGKQIQTITPFEGIQLAAAVQTLRAGDGFNLMDSARAMLGVDRLNIDSQKNTDGTTGVNVGVGKYISDKVYLEIQRTPNPNTPWQGQIEVELTPSVNFETNTGEHGQGGAKLLWRKDY